MLLVLIVSLYTTRVVLDVLGVEDYGIYNVVYGLVSILSVLNVTLSGGINRFYNYEIGKGSSGSVKNVFNAAVRIQTVLAVVIVFLVEIVGVWYLNNKMVIPFERLNIANVIFQFSAISLLLSILQTPYTAAILAYEKMDYYALVSVVDVVAKLIFTVSLRYINLDKLLVYCTFITLMSVINFLLYYTYARINFTQLRLSKCYDRDMLKKMTSFSVWMILDPIAYTVRGQGCNLVLNFFKGPILNAAYGISNQISGALNQFTGAVFTAFRPQIIQSYSSGDAARTINLMFSMSKINFVIQLALSVPVIYEINYILSIWLEEVPEFTISFTIYILLIKIFDTFNTPITTVILATGKIKTYMLTSFFIISFTLPLTYVSLKQGYSPVSMYQIMLILTLINQFSSVIILRLVFSDFKIIEYFKKVIFPCLGQMIILFGTLGGVSQVFEPTFARVIIMGLLSVIISCFSAYYLVFNDVEKGYFNMFCSQLRARILK